MRPSALQFKYRLCWYILGKHCQDLIVDKNNCAEDNDKLFIIVDGKDVEDRSTKEEIYQQEKEAMNDICEDIHDVEVLLKEKKQDEDVVKSMNKDQVENFATVALAKSKNLQKNKYKVS